MWFFSPNKWEIFVIELRIWSIVLKKILDILYCKINWKENPKKKQNKTKQNLALDMIKVYKCIFNIFLAGFVTQIYKC
jgi:hypothetical protein